MRVVKVPLEERSYEIHIGTSLLRQLGPKCAALKLGQRCAVISDKRVARLYAKPALDSLVAAGFAPALITIAPGETAKNLRSVETCYEELATHRLERKSFVVALGGGVVGDLAGFVAATYLRGLAFVQVPTTLLAQVDSSVGGKVGVNLPAGKNLIGAFHQPRLVLCDLDTLSSLPDREFRSGLAEVIKYGIIRDARLFGHLEAKLEAVLNKSPALLEEVVARCCEIKADVVATDETEGGLRAILNFGHTIGHALEAISHYGKYLHGEAIAIGQVMAAKLSSRLASLPPREADRIAGLFAQAGLPTRVRLTPTQLKRLLTAMQLDKKVSAGEVKFVLARRVGHADPGFAVPSEVLLEMLKP